MVNDHFVLWPWRPHELLLNSLHILSFTAESIIKLAWIQFQHLHLGVVWSPYSRFSLNSCVLFLILPGIMLSETVLVEPVSILADYILRQVNQTWKDISYDIVGMWNIKKWYKLICYRLKMNLKQTLSHRCREQTCGFQCGKRRGDG